MKKSVVVIAGFEGSSVEIEQGISGTWYVTYTTSKGKRLRGDSGFFTLTEALTAAAIWIEVQVEHELNKEVA
jgi:hypothetical protein